MPSLVEIGPVVLEKKIFLISSLYFCYFCYFVIISAWKRAGPFIRRNMNAHHPRMLCAKFGWKIFFNFVDVFLLFINYLLLEKCRALHLNKIASPSPKDALCKVWLKLTPWFWRRWKCENVTSLHIQVTLNNSNFTGPSIDLQRSRVRVFKSPEISGLIDWF